MNKCARHATQNSTSYRASATMSSSHHQDVVISGGFVDVVLSRFKRGRILVRTIDFESVLEMRQQSCVVICHIIPPNAGSARRVTNTKTWSSSMGHQFPKRFFECCEGILAIGHIFTCVPKRHKDLRSDLSEVNVIDLNITPRESSYAHRNRGYIQKSVEDEN
jgi:hypothetical protein